jgi:hypothetical protein
MLQNVKGLASVISAVKTELALLALVVLVAGFFFQVVSGKPGVELSLVIKTFALIFGLVIVIAGLLLFYRARRTYDENLKQNRNFARCLGEEIFKAYLGSFGNLLPGEREEAYRILYSYVTSSTHFESDAEKEFAKQLVETVMHNAGMKGWVEPEGNPPGLAHLGNGD